MVSMRTEGVAAVWFGALLLLAGSVVFPGAPLSALSLVALGVAAVLSVGQLVSRAYLPHEDDHLRWRRLLKAAPGLELERFGGPQHPDAHAGDVITRSVNCKPLVAAVHGHVMGLAVGIALECELVVAEAGTRFQIDPSW